MNNPTTTTTTAAPTNGLTGENYATLLHYTDRTPLEIIKRTAKTITVREMDYSLDPASQPDTVPGGFCGHTRNNSTQRWLLTSNPNGRTMRAHMRKNGRFYIHGTEILIGHAHKFYDYNY